MNHNKLKGFTLLEVSAAVTLFVLAMGLAIAGYMFTLKNINQGDVQNELDIDVQLAMERLKVDLRLSSLDKMFYYPEGGGPYEAISFPIAYDSDGDNILEKNADGSITWDETIIYHVRPTTPNQLVKTVFKPRDNSLTDVQRQAQIDSVVKYGDGSHTYNANHATSTVIFENLLDWSLNPKAGRFDAYSSDLTRDRASLGYILMGPGNHDITFRAVGKNGNSAGYKIGVDQLFMSASQSPREAEAQLPVKSQSGAVAQNLYMAIGSWKGDHQLYFPATAIGNSFTLTIPNDRWEETNFSGTGYRADDTQVKFDTSLSPRDFVVQLEGMDTTWSAQDQTGSEPTDTPPKVMKNWVVRMMQKGSELADNGNWFSYDGKQCKLKFRAANTGDFKITNVFIGESASTTNASLDFNEGTVEPVLFNGNKGSPIAAPGGAFESDPVELEIDKDKNYLVSYRIVNSASRCHPALWKDIRGSVARSCMVVTNGSWGIANDKTWSNRAGIDPMLIDGILGLESIDVTHSPAGTYTSQIFDTHLNSPQYKDISWDAEVPDGTTLAFKVRTGNNPDLSDALPFDSIAPFSYAGAISASYKRYVQFQAAMESDSTGLSTPKLKDVVINWTGAKQLVDVGGIFTKGPDFGVFEVSVDGEPLRTALIVDLEIYKDQRMVNDETRRISSSLEVDITPRNTGL